MYLEPAKNYLEHNIDGAINATGTYRDDVHARLRWAIITVLGQNAPEDCVTLSRMLAEGDYVADYQEEAPTGKDPHIREDATL